MGRAVAAHLVLLAHAIPYARAATREQSTGRSYDAKAAQCEGVDHFPAYTRMHRNHRAGAPAVVFTCSNTTHVQWGRFEGQDTPGLSDHMTGLISTFFHALASGLPFFIDCEPFTTLYEPATIQWRWARARLPRNSSSAHVRRVDRYGRAVQARDLSLKAINMVQTNRGVLWRRAETHQSVLSALNLTRTSAFAIIHSYLFVPSAALADLIPRIPPAPTILIQLRLGDRNIAHELRADHVCDDDIDGLQSSPLGEALRCAAELTGTLAHNDQVSWMLLTDSVCAREAFLRQHPGGFVFGAQPAGVWDYGRAQPMATFVAELEAAARADNFIITRTSGIGRQLVARAQRWSRAYDPQCEKLSTAEVMRGYSAI